MKALPTIHLLLLTVVITVGTTVQALAQDNKFKARVSAQYVKIMDKESSIRLSAKYKTKSGFEPATGVEFNIFKKISDDSMLLIGKTTTDATGKAKFLLKATDIQDPTDTSAYTYVARIENNSRFEDNESSVTFANANLSAEIQTVDSAHQISATLTDAAGKPLAEQLLTVGLQRLYAPLRIGEEFYKTDENGNVVVPLDEGMPGIGGVLTFEVSLNENEQYGTVKALVTAPIGSPITDESTFDQRTMWSPPLQAPYYLLIFPNLIILGVWLPILILVFNLYRISKS